MLRRQAPAVVVVEQPTRTQYVDRDVTIHEHRAPTDQSVQMLREMEAKAEAEVVKAVRVGDTSFECVVHQTLDAMSDSMRWNAIFKLNGKQMHVSVETPRDRFIGADEMRKSFTALRDEMAKTIADEVLHDAFIAVMRQRLGG